MGVINGFKYFNRPLVLKVGHTAIFLYDESGVCLESFSIEFEGAPEDEHVWLQGVLRSIEKIVYRGRIYLLLNGRRSITKVINQQILNLVDVNKYSMTQLIGAHVLKGLQLGDKVVFFVARLREDEYVFIGFRDSIVYTLSLALEKMGFWISLVTASVWAEHLWAPFQGSVERNYREYFCLTHQDRIDYCSEQGDFEEHYIGGTLGLLEADFDLKSTKLKRFLWLLRFKKYGFCLMFLLSCCIWMGLFYSIGKFWVLKNQYQELLKEVNESKDVLFNIALIENELSDWSVVLKNKKLCEEKKYEALKNWEFLETQLHDFYPGYVESFEYERKTHMAALKFHLSILLNQSDNIYILADDFQNLLTHHFESSGWRRIDFNSMARDHHLDIMGIWQK